ncbi:hypothetical protein [Flavisolibacter ginsenosidimutans]|uniref:Glycosyltransferase family 39 protein n=1 Tax=Flavisolibacter ginsenosidimutans TaxID=661481 RepID=A0A5B8UNY9_9BACT|nr:hypothetical protein [Flavisolibacter ginsenosidimutans]QEC58318.1 hypothetical protein FSB75_21210 [Flavisolibacter ginsenosidimutans]
MRQKTLITEWLVHKNRQTVVLIVAWIVLHLFLFFHFGIVTGLEAGKYIDRANDLVKQGAYPTDNFIFYSTEILLIAAAKCLHLGYGVVVTVQLGFNALACYCFYRIVEKLTKQNKAPFYFTLGFIAMFFYQLYNIYLFTESLYFSFSILFFYRLLKFSTFRLRQFVEVVLWLILLCFTRPVGLFFLPSTFVFIIFKFYREQATMLLLTAGVIVCVAFFFLINYSRNSGEEYDYILRFTDGYVICGIPSMPAKSIQFPVKENSLQGLAYLMIHYPGYFFSLFFQRLLAFFSAVRRYYSLPHNLFVAGYFCSLYVLAVWGIKKNFRIHGAEILFMLLLIFFTALSAGLACDEWHSRFLYTVFPFLMLLAALAFAPLQTKNKV